MRELRERLGIPAFDPSIDRPTTVTAHEAARQLRICVTSVMRLIHEGILPAAQQMPSAPWEVPVSALDSEAVRIGVHRTIERRPRRNARQRRQATPRLPGFA